MEKSIEKIWKEGFTNDTSFSIPEINDISSLKSIYFIDQFKKTYKTNIVLLIGTAVIILLAFILGDVPFIGLMMFGLFSGLAILGYRELSKLQKLNPGTTNYEFLKAFDNWLKNLLHKFSIVYRILIPLLFIGFALAILQTNFFIPFLDETLLERMVGDSAPAMIAGIPVSWIASILVIAATLSYFSTRFFKMEIRSIYGELIDKLDRSLAELEELRSA
ncbi:MAG: hypothetical protein KTR30_25445 [Saprospiraceae bacterium]|nr:hypothetical protein [Saprospiraceae bacterium]